MPEIILKGITWGHSRGISPLLAVSQRYSERHPGIEICWKKRSLQEFADFPIEKLTKDYDLLIIDHPWVGKANALNCVLPLNEYLPASYLEDQLKNTVGQSHLSYQYNKKQWALAIDAAAPAASYRKELLEKNNTEPPSTWTDLIKLAKQGRVAVPAIPIDLLMNFYTFCIAHGKTPFQNNHEVIDAETGLSAIETMKELYGLMEKKMFFSDPIAIAELMTTTDDYWYCPFSYAYSNYTRTGFAKNILSYSDTVSFDGKKLQTTIGGTGLAVSAFSKHKDIALDFAMMAASGECQCTLYVQHGGQPGHRSAWLDEGANQLTHNFFKNILPVMDNGYVRPRYNGYLHFQDHAGAPLRDCLMGDMDGITALARMNQIYQQSLIRKRSIETA